jgi:hypothetical protein
VGSMLSFVHQENETYLLGSTCATAKNIQNLRVDDA